LGRYSLSNRCKINCPLTEKFNASRISLGIQEVIFDQSYSLTKKIRPMKNIYSILFYLVLTTIFSITSGYSQTVDPIKFTISTEALQVGTNEEFELTITARYVSVPSSAAFVFEGANAYRLNLVMPRGFKQTGGDFYNSTTGELSKVKPAVTYKIKGKFTDTQTDGAFQLLRSHKNADDQSKFVQVGNLAFIAQENSKSAGDEKSNRVMLLTPNYIPSLSISELRGYGTADTIKTVYITDDKKQGLFTFIKSSITMDDSSMVIVSSNRRYKRVYEGYMRPEWFGAIPNDSGDDTQAFIKLKKMASGPMHIPAGIYIINNLNLGGVGIIGEDNGATILKSSGSNPVLILGYDVPHWRKKIVQSLTIDGNNHSSHGIEFFASSSSEM
jgi:hypothetical protein